MKFPCLQTRRAGLDACRLLLAATVAVALSGALAAVAQAQPMPDRAHHGMGGHAMGPGGEAGPMMRGRMLDAVGASADQKARIHDIMARAHDEGRAQHDSERGLRQQMLALMAAPRIDAAAAEDLRQKLQAGRDAASKRHLQALLDASAVLTPEQRQKMADTARSHQEMMQRHQQERRTLAPKG